MAGEQDLCPDCWEEERKKEVFQRRQPPINCPKHGDPRRLTPYEIALLSFYRQVEPYNIPIHTQQQVIDAAGKTSKRQLTIYQLNVAAIIPICHEFGLKFSRIHENLLKVHTSLYGRH